jgi:methyl-accepting chemotaxis protein
MKLKLSIFHKILLAMLLVALVPLSVIWYVDYRTTSEQITASIQRELSGLSDRTVTQVNDWIGMNLKALNQTAALADMATMDPKRQNPILRTTLNEYSWSYLVFTIDPKGMNVGRSDDKPPIDYSDRIYYKQIMDGKPFGSQVVISKTTNKPALILSAPIYSGVAGGERQVAGVIAMGMSIADLSARITNLRIGKTGYVFLLDENGKVVAHQKEEYADTSADFGKHPAFVARPVSGKTQLVYQDGGKQVIAYAQTTAQGWTMVTQQDYDEAYAPVRNSNIRALVILVVTLVLVTVIASWFSRLLSSPIRNLTHIADEISRGRVVTKIAEVDRGDEIGQLAGAIDRMGTSIRLAMDRLRKQA